MARSPSTGGPQTVPKQNHKAKYNWGNKILNFEITSFSSFFAATRLPVCLPRWPVKVPSSLGLTCKRVGEGVPQSNLIFSPRLMTFTMARGEWDGAVLALGCHASAWKGWGSQSRTIPSNLIVTQYYHSEENPITGSKQQTLYAWTLDQLKFCLLVNVTVRLRSYSLSLSKVSLIDNAVAQIIWQSLVISVWQVWAHFHLIQFQLVRISFGKHNFKITSLIVHIKWNPKTSLKEI